MLSGAQQSILALAIRLSIAKLIHSNHPVVLDEVTEGFDYQRIDMLKGFINQIAHEHQTIVVSHDERIISDSIGSIIQLHANN
jgi:DNA repair exonuclease SbcCD ATPase subunit